jgi:hypothetical protein
MRVRARVVLLTVTLALIVVGACTSQSSNVNKPGDDLINSTNEKDMGPPMAPPPQDSGAAGMDGPVYDVATGYMPALNTCASCSCSESKGFCFAGGTRGVTPTDAPAPACTMVDASTIEVGCNPLPPSCVATPTCTCVLEAIQAQFSCYLVCSPDPGYLLVYCPSGP